MIIMQPDFSRNLKTSQHDGNVRDEEDIIIYVD